MWRHKQEKEETLVLFGKKINDHEDNFRPILHTNNVNPTYPSDQFIQGEQLLKMKAIVWQ